MSQLDLNRQDFQERITYFVDVIVPVPIPKLFTYRAPHDMNEELSPGKRVVIQFGRKKVLTGVIKNIHQNPPKEYEAKYLLELLDDNPSLLPEQLELIDWCAQYYMSTPGEVLSVALPSGLKLSSQSFIQLNPLFDEDGQVDIREQEQLVLNNLKTQGLLSYQEVSDLLNIKNVYQLIKSMVAKEMVMLIEQVKEKYQPKHVTKIRLNPELVNDQERLRSVFERLENREKQTDLLLNYLNLVPVNSEPDKNKEGVIKSELLNPNLSPSSLKTLVKNGVMEEFSETVSRVPVGGQSEQDSPILSDSQKTTVQEIFDELQNQDVVLFHGVTGSGKTEVYIDLIRQAIDSGGQVLYMLPEIALTTQIVKRLNKVFGERLGVYHSKYSSNERVEVWRNLLEGKYDVVVGVRSSVFLPFQNLSLVIVDEEHESSFKQFEQSPRYQARDTALVLAQLHHAKTLLGSATPSFESYHNAKSGKYGLVSLIERYGTAVLPEISIASVSEERKKKTLNGEFTSALLSELKNTLEAGKQAIVFQNRRGYSPYMMCEECTHVPKCQNCSVSLTYHMYDNILRCHYCGYKESAPQSCPSCGSNRLRTVGFGTEKIEEDLRLLFPDARVERMDLDTTRSKYGYQNLIDSFEKGEIDILVGTQMVTKGLDFDNVRLVGVLDLDRMLHFPDFRSTERCFQLVTQVSGRAGRRDEPGLVVIQTNDPHQPAIKHMIEQDFVEFYNAEIPERSNYLYPPFYRLIKLVFKHRDEKVVNHSVIQVAQKLKQEFGDRVLGPKEPLIGKIRNHYLMEILIKVEKSKINLPRLKDLIKEHVFTILNNRELKGTIVNFDVDPF